MRKIVAVVSIKGGVGKSVIANHAFNKDQVVTIDSQNLDANGKAGKPAEEINNIVEPIFIGGGNRIIDVGAPSYKTFMKGLTDLSAIQAVTTWIVVVNANIEALVNGLQTVKDILSRGVEKSRVLVVYNKTPMLSDGGGVDQNKIGSLYTDFQKDSGIKTGVIVPETDIFAKMAKAGTTIPELMKAECFRDKMSKEEDPKRQVYYLNMFALQQLAKNIDAKLEGIRNRV